MIRNVTSSNKRSQSIYDSCRKGMDATRATFIWGVIGAAALRARSFMGPKYQFSCIVSLHFK